VVNLLDALDQRLDDRCDQCGRVYRWCECGLPAYFTAETLRDPERVRLACERWLLEDPAGCPMGRHTIFRLWAAYRRAERR
jgi:hypothetical protein